MLRAWRPIVHAELLPFTGGWVGYFSYDTVRYVEKKKLPFSGAPSDDRNLPDVHLGLYDDVIVFDHVEKVFILEENIYIYVTVMKYMVASLLPFIV